MMAMFVFPLSKNEKFEFEFQSHWLMNLYHSPLVATLFVLL